MSCYLILVETNLLLGPVVVENVFCCLIFENQESTIFMTVIIIVILLLLYDWIMKVVCSTYDVIVWVHVLSGFDFWQDHQTALSDW